MEQQPERLRLDLEWESPAGGAELVILDEEQSWPDVFPPCEAPSTAGAREMAGSSFR
jgi:hypothetical protein